jgi:hypothetical protein
MLGVGELSSRALSFLVCVLGTRPSGPAEANDASEQRDDRRDRQAPHGSPRLARTLTGTAVSLLAARRAEAKRRDRNRARHVRFA